MVQRSGPGLSEIGCDWPRPPGREAHLQNETFSDEEVPEGSWNSVSRFLSRMQAKLFEADAKDEPEAKLI